MVARRREGAEDLGDSGLRLLVRKIQRRRKLGRRDAKFLRFSALRYIQAREIEVDFSRVGLIQNEAVERCRFPKFSQVGANGFRQCGPMASTDGSGAKHRKVARQTPSGIMQFTVCDVVALSI